MEYFSGRKMTDEFVIPQFRQPIRCMIFAYWEQLRSRVFECGQKEMLTLEKTVGVEKNQLSEFEGRIKSEIGAGIFGAFVTEIRGRTQKMVAFKSQSRFTEQIQIGAKDCERLIFTTYQLIREYQFEFTEKKLFGLLAKQRHLTVTEKCDNFYDESIKKNSFDNCNCPNRADDPGSTVLGTIILSFPKQNLVVNTLLESSGTALHIQTLNLEIQPVDFGRILNGTYTIEKRDLPAHLEIFFTQSVEPITIQLFSICDCDSNMVFQLPKNFLDARYFLSNLSENEEFQEWFFELLMQGMLKKQFFPKSDALLDIEISRDLFNSLAGSLDGLRENIDVLNENEDATVATNEYADAVREAARQKKQKENEGNENESGSN